MSKWVYNGWEFPSVRVEPPTERYLKLIACPETTGFELATVLCSHIPPKSSTGTHTHLDSDEIMYCIGRGVCIIGDERIKLEADSVIVAPKGVEHECQNTSETDTLKLFCVYVPPLKLNPLLAGLAKKTREYLESK
jgi:mannose-6-phosphate isomerase-like protein (cupin superfamily)